MGINLNVSGSGKIDVKAQVATGCVDVKTDAQDPALPPAAGTPAPVGDAGIHVSATTSSPELDQGYKYVVEIILNLNHDRYKSYFNYFIVLHLGIVAAMRADFTEAMADAPIYLSIIGLALGLCWVAVLYKIQKDIEQAWSLIKGYEASPQYTQTIKVSETGWKGFRASRLMLFIPFGFLAFYVLALLT